MAHKRELYILISVMAICALAVWQGPSQLKPDSQTSVVEPSASPQEVGATPQKSTATSQGPVNYSSQDLSIGGVFLGESREAVSQKLGESKDDPLIDDYCHYPGLRVQFYNNVVHRLSGTQLDYQGKTLLIPQASPFEVGQLMAGSTHIYARPGLSYGYDGDDWELRVETSDQTYPIRFARKLKWYKE